MRSVSAPLLLLAALAAGAGAAAGTAGHHPLLPTALVEMGKRAHGEAAMAALIKAVHSVGADLGGVVWDVGASNCSLIAEPNVEIKTGIASGGACSQSFNMYTSLAAGGFVQHLPASIATAWGKTQEWAICAAGLACDDSTMDPKSGFLKCDAAQKPGDACVNDNCQAAQVQNTFVNGFGDMQCDGKKCTTMSDWGGPCTSDSDCEGSYSCVSGKCDGKVPKGSKCASSTDCKGPYTCMKGMCAEGVDVGSPCESDDNCWNGNCNKALASPVCAAFESIDAGGKSSNFLSCKTLAIDNTKQMCVDSRPGGTVAHGGVCTSPLECKELTDTCLCSGSGKGTCGSALDVKSFVDAAFECVKGNHAACPDAPPGQTASPGSSDDACLSGRCKEAIQNYFCAVYLYGMLGTNNGDSPSGWSDAKELFCPSFSVGLAPGFIALIVIGSLLCVGGMCVAAFIVRRNRKSQPRYVDASAAGGAYVPPGGPGY